MMVEFESMRGERVVINRNKVLWAFSDPAKIGTVSLVLQIIPVASPAGRLEMTLFTLDVKASLATAAMLLDGEQIIDLSHAN